MTFIVTLISLVIERFFHWRHLRQWRWFSRYQIWLAARVGHWPSSLLLVTALLPPLFIVGLINGLLSHWILGIVKLVFNVIVVMYCLGPNNFWVQVYGCVNALHKEDLRLAAEQVDAAFATGPLDDAQAFHRTFINVIFQTAYQRIFAVIFWFVLIGPIGAVLYRLMTLCAKESPLGLTSIAADIQNVLDWLPIRVFTFLFTLGGHFTDTFICWKHHVLKGIDSNHPMLTECGLAALDVVEQSHIAEGGVAEAEALSLLDRVFVMGLVILAVAVLLVS